MSSRPRRMRRSGRRQAGILGTLLAVTIAWSVAGTPGLAATEGAWTDRVHATGSFTSGHWATTGTANASAVGLTVWNKLLGLGTAVTVSPIASSTANATVPGPDTKSVAGPATISTPLLGGYATATAVTTTARFTPRLLSSSASVATVRSGITILGSTELISITSVNGPISAAATCPSSGAPTATASALSDLRVSLLGTPAVPLGAGGSLGVTVGGTTVNVTVDRVLSTTPTVGAPSASATLVARVAASATLLSADITLPLASADCSATVI